MSGTLHIRFLVRFGLSWIKVMLGSRVSGRYFVCCLSLGFNTEVGRLIGVF